jgi:predicted Zn-dependent peptidase
MTSIASPDRKQMPRPGTISQINLTNPETILLPNNMEASIIRAGKEPITRVDVVFEAGSAYQNKKLVAGSTNNLLKEGTSEKSSAVIAGILDYHGAYLNTQINKDTASVTLYTLTKHLDNLMPLLGEIISDAVFPEKELQIYLDRQKQQFLVNIEKVRYLASMEFNQMIFGTDSAYGQILCEEDFSMVTREDIIGFYRSRFRTDKAYVILSGSITDKVIELTEKYLGNLPYNDNTLTDDQVIYTTDQETGEKYFERSDAMQSALRVGKQIINKTHPDFPALQMVNTLLGGYFGSRLMSNLREDKGYTYGINSYIQTYKHAAYFAVATEVNADYTEAAMKEIDLEINRLKSTPVGNDELKLVKNYLFGNFLKSFDGPLALAERFRAVKDAGLDFTYYKQSIDAMMKITPEQVMKIANKYFDRESLLHLIVGKK